MSPDGGLNIRQDVSVSVASPEAERRMAVRVADWNRIREDVEALGEPLVSKAMLWASVALGIGLTAAGIAVPLQLSTSTPDGWVPALWVATAFSLVFALCFYLVGKRDDQRRGASCDRVCQDMDRVSEAHQRGDAGA
jgi:hypothetical protein